MTEGHDATQRLPGALFNGLRVLIVAGVPTGVLVGGIGSRLAILLLRITSPDRVTGVRSDDGFVIGRFTLGGTYNLMALGATLGVMGAGLYQWVAPSLIGPRWFRRMTVGMTCGAVIGSMLIHPSGVDFTVLRPTWLAVATFIVIPALFGAAIGVAVDSVRSTPPGNRSWWPSVMMSIAFPMSLVVLVPAAAILAAWVALRRSRLLTEVAVAPWLRLAVRAAWISIALLGARALLHDLDDLASS